MTLMEKARRTIDERKGEKEKEEKRRSEKCNKYSLVNESREGSVMRSVRIRGRRTFRLDLGDPAVGCRLLYMRRVSQLVGVRLTSSRLFVETPRPSAGVTVVTVIVAAVMRMRHDLVSHVLSLREEFL